MISQDAFTKGQALISTIIQKMTNLKASRIRTVSEILMLFISLRGRVNFSQLGRQGDMCEKSYRLHFEKDFDWLSFNKILVEQVCSDQRIIGFDPSYIPKSGKHTPDLGYYYSGVASKYKKGLEIGNISVIDINQNTAYHLEAVQSPKSRKDVIGDTRTLVDHYAELIMYRAETIEKISTVLVVDGYFAKYKFVNPISKETNLEVICRLRDDANLKYLYTGVQKTGRGRKRKYEGKVDVKKIDKRRIKKEFRNKDITIYSGVVYSVGLKRKIKICYVEFFNNEGKVEMYKIFFSTNEKRKGVEILSYYKARFQMEFNFRDGKQYTGLEHGQSRSTKKLHFHFNASLTSVNIAKCILRSNIDKNTSIPLSVGDLKMQLQNRNMLYRIFSIYGFDHKLIKLNNEYKEVLRFGSIAA